MKLDRTVLRWARPEALERLARALGIELRPRPPRLGAVDRWCIYAAREIERVTCPEGAR